VLAHSTIPNHNFCVVLPQILSSIYPRHNTTVPVPGQSKPPLCRICSIFVFCY
jgi:hypothetical protein